MCLAALLSLLVPRCCPSQSPPRSLKLVKPPIRVPTLALSGPGILIDPHVLSYQPRGCRLSPSDPQSLILQPSTTSDSASWTATIVHTFKSRV